MVLDDAYACLIEALLDAFVATGMTKIVLPEGRRDEVVSLMTRLMARRDLLAAYNDKLEAERASRGADVEMRLLGMDGLDVEDERIALEGFARLSDDQLADLAISPEGLKALDAYLIDQRTVRGQWWYDAVTREPIQRPADAPPLEEVCGRFGNELN